MSGILSDEGGESKTESAVDAVPESVLRTLKVAMEESESGETRNGKIVRTFLLVDVGEAVRYLRGRNGKTSEVAEKTVEKAIDAGSDETTTSTSPAQESQGRGMLSRLLLVGAVVGLGYLLKSRSGPVDEAVSKTTEQLHSVADKTAVRSGEVAQRTEAVVGQAAEGIQETGEMAADQVETGTEEAADRVRESGETAADQVQEGGQKAADQVQEGGQKAADQIDEAAETAEETQEQQGDEGEEASSEDDQSDEE
ncbi:hypothetical protein [Halomicrococcus sp. SG-WS-1]|uniref:hypothetical protein n=1 Tax=Halomicrococcus sp. SG-WS-1 TaxID=3439057 RepID=UPI003F792991